MSLNPWFALILGLVVGWFLQTFVERWFMRRRRLSGQERLDDSRAERTSRDAELASASAHLHRASAPAAEAPEVPTAAEAETPKMEVDWPALAAGLAEAQTSHLGPGSPSSSLGAELPASGVALPDTALPALSAETPSARHVDDLVVIQGIGPKYGAKLVAAGITSFAALAASDDARLDAIIQAPEWRRPDYASWRQQARSLMAGSK